MFEVRDGYKVSHCKQYPENTTMVYSNLTARGSRVQGQDFTIFFGLQYFIKKYLIEDFNKFFAKPKEEAVAEFKELMDGYLGESQVDMSECEDLHDLGFLPITIKALPEGTKVPLRVPMLTIVNTLPKFYWLTNALETILSTTLWMPITNATTAYRFKKLFDDWAIKTGGSLEFTPFQGHDFSMRGMAGLEAGQMSGSAHLTSFVGTDTVPAIPFVKKYYDAEGFIGCSVPATEHSVMCLHGDEDELGTFRELITNRYPTGVISIVSDTWDFWKVVTEYLPALKDTIMAREGGELSMDKVVIRPDSGDPVDIICGTGSQLTGIAFDINQDDEFIANSLETEGRTDIEIIEEYMDFDEMEMEGDKHVYNFSEEKGEKFGHCESMWKYKGKFYHCKVDWYNMYDGREEITRKTTEYKVPDQTPEEKGLIECLWDTFGGTVNDKGFKELDSHIGAIYGDAITYERATEICKRLADKGFASTNLVYGIGSWTYQGQVTRDTYNMAVKATFGVVDGEKREIFKAPKTGDGMKNSLKGLLQVIKDVNGKLVVKDQCTWVQEKGGLLEEVFHNGVLRREDKFEDIRARIRE